jgi:hypothetical protein
LIARGLFSSERGPRLPHLVVMFSGDKVEALPAPDRHQARLMLAQLAPSHKSKD